MTISMRAAALAVACFQAPFAATAGEELLVGNSIDFAMCPSSIVGMLTSLQASPEQVRVEIDTAAIYRVKLVAAEANLVFHCSKTEGRIEIWRTTPGELSQAG